MGLREDPRLRPLDNLPLALLLFTRTRVEVRVCQTNTGKSEDNFCDSFVSFYHVGVVRFGGEHPYPLALLANSDGRCIGLGMG